MRQRLILEVPDGAGTSWLDETLRGGDVAAVVLPADHRELRDLVDVAQGTDVAAMLAYDVGGEQRPWPLPHGADGAHLVGPTDRVGAVIEARPEGASVGALAASRHEAMVFGECGADYVWFGRTADLDEEAVERAAWWQALFEVPGVLAGPNDERSVALMVATRVEFIAVNLFSGTGGPLASGGGGSGGAEMAGEAAADMLERLSAMLERAPSS